MEHLFHLTEGGEDLCGSRSGMWRFSLGPSFAVSMKHLLQTFEGHQLVNLEPLRLGHELLCSCAGPRAGC